MNRLPVVSELVDSFARRVSYLRISLTDRCNYRCTYCMPDEMEHLAREDVLSYEEIGRIVTVFAKLGVRRVRLTGGEPTVRRDVVDCVATLAAIDGIEQVVMTSNGQRLVELADDLVAAGLAEVNVSIDSLDPERFRTITRKGDVTRVLAGIDALLAAGIGAVKLNTVALAGFNDDELGALCDYAWQRNIVPRFIEWMPMSGGDLYAPGSFMAASAIRHAISTHVGVEAVAVGTGSPQNGPSRYYRVGGADDARTFGVISAISENFCESCNRMRVTSTGGVHACLAYDDDVDLRHILRNGGTDADLGVAILGALTGKRESHEFTAAGCGGPRTHMVSIGG